MALIKADRVKETSTSTGNGTFSLAGAATGYRTFSSVCAVGDTFFYGISNQTSGEWETGLGTYSATNTLTRTTVHSSSNSGAIVTFGAGTKEVFLTASAQYLERIVDNGLLTSTGSATSVVAVNDGPQPQLDLAFSADKTLTARYGPTPSYSRASTGTYFNASGVLTSAAINAPRFDHAYENGVWVSKGLLIEEQRTNTALYSSDIGNVYWGGTSTKTANFGISPDGTQNAARITGGGYFQSGSISKTGTQTFSFWAKTISGNSENIDVFLDGGFVTTSKTITGSWVRYSVTQTFGSTNTGTIGIYPLSANILFYGPQLEAGVFATSYIPTTTTSVVRSADVCQITGSDFSGIWNTSQGSFASEWDAQRNSTGQFTIYWVRDSADNNVVVHSGREALTPPGVRFSVASGGASSAEIISSGFPAVGATTRTAGAYKANDFAYAYSGSLVGTDTSGAVPVSPTEMRIGYDPYTSWLNGHLSRLRYFNTRLDNQTLVQLSGGINNLVYKTVTGSGNATVTNNYTNINVSVPNPLPVTNGGTGATSSLAAVNNLVGNPPNDGGQYTLASKKTSGTPTFYWVDSTGYAPTLDLLFAADKTLTAYRGPTTSYSRASTGTYFNASGVLTSAAINAPRFDHTYNGTSWISRGLLVEEQRTNVVLNSADFTSGWTTANVAMATSSGTSPDGTNTAVKLYPTTSTTQTRIYRSSTQRCISVFAKAAEKQFVYFYDRPGVYVCWFNLSTGAIGTNATSLSASISNCGNGWFRCSLAASSGSFSFFQIGVSDADGSTSSTASGTNGILIWGAQEEAGSFATSYIPTTSASATRSADVCQITGSDFSGFWNGTEGSFAVDYDSASPQGWTGAYPVLIFSDSSTNAKRIWYSGEGGLGGNRFYVDDPSGSTTLIATPISGGSIPTKASAAYKQNDLAFSYNGGTPYTGASQLIPSGIDILRIGQNPASGNQFCGHISRLRYYPVRIPNATLQTLST